jgi:hypothetical protein
MALYSSVYQPFHRFGADTAAEAAAVQAAAGTITDPASYQTGWPGILDLATGLTQNATQFVNAAQATVPPVPSAPSSIAAASSPLLLLAGAAAVYYFFLRK